MKTPCVSNDIQGEFHKVEPLKIVNMLELFIELTNQIFWDGYAENLAHENPAAFQLEYTEFLNGFNY
ncbi:hypothetical protein [Mucilaginibacter paludis]|uniref:Uncharacterized protein n=1 Tax=Mucilaginibacter paludis DSM 18603 TaxID=714943 RepID=H1XZ72_9SPHI|nr:hypothetical protein [Mucilaginibacter paludis]EHQ24657.1 hypothetical protein Mucpa_0463 [Mucilaginibacter paludis DSM 18603]